MKILFISVILLGGAILLMCLGMIIKRGGHFPKTHIEDNDALRNQGIGCANTQLEEEAHRKKLRDRIS